MPSSDLASATPRDEQAMVSSLLAIWFAGPTLFLGLILAAPPAHGFHTVLGVDLAAYGFFAGFVVMRKRLHRYAVDISGLLSYVLVVTVIATYDDPGTPYALFYFWLAVHTWYFLPWRRAVWQIVAIAGSYAWVLDVTGSGGFQGVRWVLTVVTISVICILVGTLRLRVDRLLTQLAAAARTDPLTGLWNRRAFTELLDAEFSRASRARRPLSLLIADLDHFKLVNDDLGHQGGDDLLRRFATVLLGAKRQMDIAFRFGGEEFAVVLPETDAGNALVLAERLRLAVEQSFADEPHPVTVSIGVASYPANAASVASLLRCADEAMYAAKELGRNRTVVFDAASVAELGTQFSRQREQEVRRQTALKLLETLLTDHRTEVVPGRMTGKRAGLSDDVLLDLLKSELDRRQS